MKGVTNMLKEILGKVNGVKVVKYLGFAVAGVAAVAQAVSKDKDAETLSDLVKRVSELENREA